MIGTIVSFLVALTLLIFVHELGHYLAARRCGVKVLRFSIGFGKPLLRWRVGPDQTEWAIGAVPLGGYVKMLDERDQDVAIAPADRERAFNRKPLWARSVVVIAGPAANFLLAIALYALLGFAGVEEPVPMLAAPPANSVAAKAGVQEFDRIVAVDGNPIASWHELRLRLIEPILAHDQVALQVERDGAQRTLELALDSVPVEEAERNFLPALGLELAPGRVVLGPLTPQGPAQRAGLLEGDEVLTVDGRKVGGSRALVELVRASAGRVLEFRLLRKDAELTIAVPVDTIADESAGSAGKQVGRIGAALHEQLPMQTLRYGPLAAIGEGARKTWDMSWFSLRMFGKMITGELSMRNLSGPVTIADLAGRTARIGWQAYVNFLALVSISLGVLNLLPVPVLDGGHLVYYALEGLRRRPLSERFIEITQKAGVGFIVLLMAVALFNDFVRLFGP